MELTQKISTDGFNAEIVDYKSVNMTVWNVGRRETTRTLWRKNYAEAQVS